MKDLIEKFKKVEEKISKEKSDFNLFALFQREDAQDKWDLILSAKWFEKNEKNNLDFIANKLSEEMTAQELTSISRIITLGTTDPFVKNINEVIKAHHGGSHFINCKINNIYVKEAFIITSNKINGENK